MYPTSSQWLKRLIAFDSTSHLSNLALVQMVADFAQSLGVEPIWTYNHDQTKANLFLTVYNAQDPHQGRVGGLVLSSHSDVVPVAGQAWSHDPFCAWEQDGKLFGRGACDMKGFLACCLAFLPKAVSLARANLLSRPMHLAMCFDEEVGCLGVPILLEDLAKRGITPAHCVVGEPTSMQVVTAHKGINVFMCRVRGKAVHSSLTTGVSAIVMAVRLIEYIITLAQELKHLCQAGFDVPFATLSVGSIKGGTAVNIVPEYCEFVFEYRNLPKTNPQILIDQLMGYAHTLEEAMQQTCPNTSIEIVPQVSVPALDDANNNNFARQLHRLLDDKTDFIAQKVAYATEAGHFSAKGICTVVCGPGSIAQAHQADEFIALSELQKCDEFLDKVFAKN